MTDLPLSGCRVLVVEDEFLIADELRGELAGAGAQVLGPIGHLEGALTLARAEGTIDAAVLDLNLGGTEVFPLADLLIERGVPVVFSTGYDAASLPSRFAAVPTCLKPVPISALVTAVKNAFRPPQT